MMGGTERKGCDGAWSVMRAELTFGRVESLDPPFTTASASENVAWFIRAMIFSGELGPGDRLPSGRDLSARLGISIVTLRLALKALEVAGYLVTSRGARGGSRVNDLNALTRCWTSWMRGKADEVDEICELRETIEVKVAQLAAERRSETELEAIEQANTLLLAPGSSVLRWNVAFHDALAHAAHNRHLQRAMVEVRGELFLPADMFLREHRVVELVAAHGAVLDAVRARNADAAAECMRSHLVDTRAVIRQSVQESAEV
jgi:GntR family transcriptional repressor for pyruvate dehydrogenase complex